MLCNHGSCAVIYLALVIRLTRFHEGPLFSWFLCCCGGCGGGGRIIIIIFLHSKFKLMDEWDDTIVVSCSFEALEGSFKLYHLWKWFNELERREQKECTGGMESLHFGLYPGCGLLEKCVHPRGLLEGQRKGLRAEGAVSEEMLHKTEATDRPVREVRAADLVIRPYYRRFQYR